MRGIPFVREAVQRACARRDLLAATDVPPGAPPPQRDPAPKDTERQESYRQCEPHISEMCCGNSHVSRAQRPLQLGFPGVPQHPTSGSQLTVYHGLMRVTEGLRSPIIIVGLHSSGKTTLARTLASVLGVRVFELGFGVRQAAQAAGRDVLVEVARDLMGDDPLFLAKCAIERAGSQRQHSIFVGPRTPVEFEFLVGQLIAPVTVGLNATYEYRHDRWRHRHLKYADKWEQREWQERHWETGKLIQNCRIIVNAADELGAKQNFILKELAKAAELA